MADANSDNKAAARLRLPGTDHFKKGFASTMGQPATCGRVALWFVTLALLVIVGLQWSRHSASRVSVNGEPEGIFPVLVITPGSVKGTLDATIVRYSELKGYMASHVGASYLVPAGHAEELNAKLKQPGNSGGKFVGGFEVQDLPGGEQMLKVTRKNTESDARCGSGTQAGWYTANARGIRAQYFSRQVDTSTVAALTLPFAAAANVILWWLFGSIAWLIRLVISRRTSDHSTS